MDSYVHSLHCSDMVSSQCLSLSYNEKLFKMQYLTISKVNIPIGIRHAKMCKETVQIGAPWTHYLTSNFYASSLRMQRTRIAWSKSCAHI